MQKTVTVQATNLVNGDSVELTVSYNGEMIEAGEYIATATLTAHQNYKLTANNTVKVTITRTTHTVTFKQNGFADIVKEVLDLADLTDIPTPQHVDGYTFTWNRTEFTSITEDITVTANKELITYKIEYVVYDGVNSVSNPTTYTVESATFTLKNPTPSETFGKSFGGWFTSPDFTTENKITKIEKGSFGDLKLYAYWLEYRVTEVVGGTVDYSQSTPEITIKVDYGTANLAVKDLISVSDGCTWKLYTGFECLPTQELTAKRLTVSNIGDNIFYILVYHPDSDEYYTDYILNVYQLDMKAYTFIKDGETWVSGEIQEENTLSAPENPEKTGYTFNGWKVNGEFVSFPYTALTDTEFVADYTLITYNVSYELNGGENDESNPKTYNIEQAYTLKNPTRTGYTFVGWFTEEIFDNQATGIALGSHGDKKFYAKWNIITYTVSYELNGGENSAENPKTYTVETETITLVEPTKTGYGFKGWYLEETLKTRVYTIEKGSHGDKKFYAKWEENTNTLKFDGNGATDGEMDSVQIKTTFTAMLPECGFERAGYTFIGYATSANGSVVYDVGDTYTMGTNAEYTLYAKWTANLNTLKFDGNGATGGSTAEMSIYTDETKALTANGFVKAGYTFIGWATSENGEVVYTDGASYTMGTNAEYTLYAKWTANLNTLKFNGNGATGGSTAQMSIYTDQTKALTANGFVKAGYTFIGWAIEADGEVVYTDGVSYTMGVNTEYTLYAKWQANLNTLKFNGNGATGGSTAEMSIYTDETKALTANGFEKAGYTFIGWAIEADGDVVYSDGANYTMGINAEYTLYAKWTANLNTLKFDGNGATGGSTAQMNIYTDETKPLNTNGFEKTGYVFAGWALTADSEVVYTDKADYTMGVNAEYTLYAVWTPIPYAITYELDGGTNHENNPESLTILSVLPITLEEPSRIGYTFGGWYFDDNFTQAIQEITEIKEYTIYSLWVEGTEGLIYSISNGECTVTGYEGVDKDVVIPTVYNGYSVTSISGSAFKNCSDLTSVVIPKSVTSIGDSAFYGCSSLTSITIPDSVTSIGDSAFRYCDSLTSVYITDIEAWCNISGIFDLMGYGSSNKNLYLDEVIVTRLEIPDTVTSIGWGAFYNCSSLTSVVIPDSVKSIDSFAFKNCSSLMSVVIPDSVTSIGYHAFYNCSNLTSVYITDIEAWCNISGIFDLMGYGSSNKNLYLDEVIVTRLEIPDTVTSIGDYAFRYCNSLTSVTIPDSVTSIGSSAFRYCNSLTSVVIGNGVTSIGDYAFNNCSNLTSVVIGNSVTSIGDYAFRYCDSLTSVVIPDSVVSIGCYAFAGCTKLTSIIFEDVSAWYRTTYEDDWGNKAYGTLTILTDSSVNVTYFRSTYDNYYWYKL